VSSIKYKVHENVNQIVKVAASQGSAVATAETGCNCHCSQDFIHHFYHSSFFVFFLISLNHQQSECRTDSKKNQDFRSLSCSPAKKETCRNFLNFLALFVVQSSSIFCLRGSELCYFTLSLLKRDIQILISIKLFDMLNA